MNKLNVTLLKCGPLTPRECDVLLLLGHGLLRKQIADQLNTSINTVSRQIERIAIKLQSKCSAEIVSTAVGMGLISIKANKEHHFFTQFGVSALLLINILNIGGMTNTPIRTQRTTRGGTQRVVRTTRTSRSGSGSSGYRFSYDNHQPIIDI